MTKLFAVLFLVFGLCAATSQSCSYTYNLRELYGYSNSLATAESYSDLKYCTSLASGSCCTDTEINALGTASDNYVANLTTMVSTRDLYLKNIKDNILPNLLTEINSFNTAAATFVSKLESGSDFGFSDMSDFSFGDDESDDDDIDWSEFSDDDSDIDWSEFSDDDDSDIDWSEFSDDYDYSDDEDDGDFGLLDTFAAITNMTTALVDNANTIKANYGTYQTDRRTCILAMADIQNSARCLACDPNANTKGFTDFLMEYEDALSSELADDRAGDDNSDVDEEVEELGDIIEYDEILFYFNFDDATCNRLQAACKPYLSDAQGQNSLIEAAYAATLITGLTSALTSFNNGNFEAGLEEIMTLFDDEDSDGDDDIVAALMEGYLPEDCDVNGDCEWICEGLFSNGIVDPLALIIGGDYSEDLEVDERRRLAQKRRLGGSTSTSTSSSSSNDDDAANGTWAPAQGASGVTVSFAVDPANTNPSTKKFGSLNLGNVFVGMMVVISSILLF